MAHQTQKTQQTDNGREPEGGEARQADQLFTRLADLVARLDACVARLAAAAAQREGGAQ